MLVKNTPVHCIYYKWNVLRLTLHRPIKSLATASKSSSPQTLLWTRRTAIWLSRSCVMVDLRYVFSLRRVENDRSPVLADHVLILSTLFHWNLIYGPNSSGCDAPTGFFLWVHSHPTLPRSRRLCLTPPAEGFSWAHLREILHGPPQCTKSCTNIAEKFNRLSRVQERHRRQTPLPCH